MTDSYVSLDLETTGLNPKMDKIIEIGAVKVLHGEVVDTFASFVNPARLLNDKVKKLTGIMDANLVDAPLIEEILPTLLDFVGELPLLGHSILFDYSFIKKAAVNQKKSFEKQGIDTLRIARKYLPDLESRNLGFLCKHFGILHTEHRALGDAEATHALYLELCKLFMSTNERESSIRNKRANEMAGVFAPRQLLYQVKKESPITKHQKERLYELICKHKVIIDYDVEHLTKNEASRQTDIILSKYGR